MSSFLYRIGRASFRRRGRVLAGWLVVLALLGLLALLGSVFGLRREVSRLKRELRSTNVDKSPFVHESSGRSGT